MTAYFGFTLVRGDRLVYNHTGLHPAAPLRGEAPDWVRELEGKTTAEIATLGGDPQRDYLANIAREEEARYRRSRGKLGGPDCVFSLWLPPGAAT